MKCLTRFVNEKNLWNNMFDRELMDLSKLNNTLAQKLFDMLKGELSPENRRCDGELLMPIIASTTTLNGAVKDLEKLGYSHVMSY